MSNEPLNKLQNAVTRATAAIGIKTAVFVGSAKIKTQIATVKDDIETLMLNLGNTVFQYWENGEESQYLIEQECNIIKKKYEIIEELNAEIEKLEREEKEVMGSKAPQGARQAENKISFVCPNCNTTFDKPVNFCRKCGTKME